MPQLNFMTPLALRDMNSRSHLTANVRSSEPVFRQPPQVNPAMFWPGGDPGMMVNYNANMPVYRFGVPQWPPVPGYVPLVPLPPMAAA